jgi:hypothetical protein
MKEASAGAEPSFVSGMATTHDVRLAFVTDF